MAHTRKPTPARTAGPYSIRRGEIWAVDDPSDRPACIGTIYRTEAWTEGEPIRTEDQANAAFISRALNCHDDLLAACKAFVDFDSRAYTKQSDFARDLLIVRKAARGAIAKATAP